jgi:hypothetical protein
LDYPPSISGNIRAIFKAEEEMPPMILDAMAGTNKKIQMNGMKLNGEGFY